MNTRVLCPFYCVHFIFKFNFAKFIYSCPISWFFWLQVIAECTKAEEWFKEKKAQQDQLPRSANPVLLSAEVKKKVDVLDR